MVVSRPLKVGVTRKNKSDIVVVLGGNNAAPGLSNPPTALCILNGPKETPAKLKRSILCPDAVDLVVTYPGCHPLDQRDPTRINVIDSEGNFIGYEIGDKFP
jgi:hypothetical protein